uniref:Uncharacterized protein n=1 Tax=Branchiostoma floridae TaxID=7739 RepID=C3Y486_BRAFL|eukprot:XP_002609102.1 hypothetical protein BRAFLDRAFT_91080 [Branchiostoma floridae]
MPSEDDQGSELSDSDLRIGSRGKADLPKSKTPVRHCTYKPPKWGFRADSPAVASQSRQVVSQPEEDKLFMMAYGTQVKMHIFHGEGGRSTSSSILRSINQTPRLGGKKVRFAEITNSLDRVQTRIGRPTTRGNNFFRADEVWGLEENNNDFTKEGGLLPNIENSSDSKDNLDVGLQNSRNLFGMKSGEYEESTPSSRNQGVWHNVPPPTPQSSRITYDLKLVRAQKETRTREGLPGVLISQTHRPHLVTKDRSYVMDRWAEKQGLAPAVQKAPVVYGKGRQVRMGAPSMEHEMVLQELDGGGLHDHLDNGLDVGTSREVNGVTDNTAPRDNPDQPATKNLYSVFGDHDVEKTDMICRWLERCTYLDGEEKEEEEQGVTTDIIVLPSILQDRTS